MWFSREIKILKNLVAVTAEENSELRAQVARLIAQNDAYRFGRELENFPPAVQVIVTTLTEDVVARQRELKDLQAKIRAVEVALHNLNHKYAVENSLLNQLIEERKNCQADIHNAKLIVTNLESRKAEVQQETEYYQRLLGYLKSLHNKEQKALGKLLLDDEITLRNSNLQPSYSFMLMDKAGYIHQHNANSYVSARNFIIRLIAEGYQFISMTPPSGEAAIRWEIANSHTNFLY